MRPNDAEESALRLIALARLRTTVPDDPVQSRAVARPFVRSSIPYGTLSREQVRELMSQVREDLHPVDQYPPLNEVIEATR